MASDLWRFGRVLIAALGLSRSATATAPFRQSPASASSAETRLAASGDAYVYEHRTRERIRWRLGTAMAEKHVEFRQGRLQLTSFTDRTIHHEYVHEPVDVPDFTWNGQVAGGPGVQWVLDGVQTERLKQGELLLRLKLHADGIAILKSYLLYPQESIIQEWLQIVNRSGQPATLTEPASLALRFLQGETSAVDFTYLNGAPMNESRYRPTTAPVAGLTQTFAGTGNMEYSPIQIYQNRETRAGVFVGWDYMGSWRSAVNGRDGQAVTTDFRVAPYTRRLAPNDSVETPKAFTGVFRGDFDDMGHQLLDYQYRYKWDYTRAPYFPGVEMEGYWKAGSWYGEVMDPISTYRKVFHLADMMRAVGADIYWRDFGWWDRQGDWNGPDWGETGRYLAQYGMQQIIYIPIQETEEDAKVAREHPDWLLGPGVGGGRIMDQARPEVTDWELRLLESKQRQWGNFQWRKDFDVVSGTDSGRMLAQDQGFRRLLQTFLDRNPGMAFHGCSSGAWDLGYEMLRFGVSWSMNDGSTDRWRAYFASYLYPPEKLENIPDRYDPNDYNKETWRGLLWNRFPTMGETEDPIKREGLRELIDIYHYLIQAGVLGRWGFVYHPRVTGDSADWYLQRLSGDHRRGVIVPGRGRENAVTIYPKGLLPDEMYDVSYQESGATASHRGTELMTQGISLSSIPAGEIIYLNLPLHPGSAADRAPPSRPPRVVQQVATHMDYHGVELRWKPGRDDNWVSYYEIYRNGVLIDRVAKGTYYFDHALGADQAAQYAVATVDGSGNRSAVVRARGVAGAPAVIVDDTSRALTYTGTGWEHQTKRWLAANGTQTITNTEGDAVSYTFTGSRITWYGRMGREMGIAAVYLDDQLERLVDTYSADEIPNLAVYSRVFPSAERHTLKIVVLGAQTGLKRAIEVNKQRGMAAQVQAQLSDDLLERAGDTTRHKIVIDGFQVEQTLPYVVPRAPEPVGRTLGYTFTGTGIMWVGRRCETCGIADVYVDGRLEASVDTYAPALHVAALSGADEERQVPLFTRRWPTRGRHTVKLVVRPDAHLWAKGRTVYVDAWHLLR